MVSSPLHVCGCGFHLRWSYDLRCTGVEVVAVGETWLWGAREAALGSFDLTFEKKMLWKKNVIV